MILTQEPEQISTNFQATHIPFRPSRCDLFPNPRRLCGINAPKKKNADLFSRLPDEIIEHIGTFAHTPSWPPPHCVLTDWSSKPSPGAQRTLSSLARVCRRLYCILMPLLMYEMVHDFDNQDRANPLPYQLRYQWLEKHCPWSFSRSIRIMHLRDLGHYVEPPVAMDCILEVLVVTGFCASVLLETIPLHPFFKLEGLVTLKLYVYTLSVESMYDVFRACPNLTSLALDVLNFRRGSADLAPVSTSITNLDLSTRLYLEHECTALELIFRPLASTLRRISIHGAFHAGLAPVFDVLKSSPLTHLALCFHNSFPRALMSSRFPKLQRLTISTYARPMQEFWSAPLLRPVTHLSIRMSGLPSQPESGSKLRELKLQSFGPPWDCNEESLRELDEIKDWCLNNDVKFIDGSRNSRTIECTDVYDDWSD
ncbi:hypothetical protein DFH28DRAFT_963658 [Melampsora americana]|nr:hypothetical protein DFH28DRAFT_963658 [Melampsora americana]